MRLIQVISMLAVINLAGFSSLVFSQETSTIAEYKADAQTYCDSYTPVIISLKSSFDEIINSELFAQFDVTYQSNEPHKLVSWQSVKVDLVDTRNSLENEDRELILTYCELLDSVSDKQVLYTLMVLIERDSDAVNDLVYYYNQFSNLIFIDHSDVTALTAITDRRVMFLMGLRYIEGYLGTPLDPEQAFAWFELAAPEHIPSAYNMGVMYYHGVGAYPSLGQAMVQYKASAAAGFTPAEYALENFE